MDVVDDLRDHPCPVDRVNRANRPARLERGIVGDRFNQVLTGIKYTIDCHVDDVVIEQRKHLGRLERTHPANRREHDNPNALFAPHRIFGGAPGIATGRTENVQHLTALGHHPFEEVAQQLHRHVFKSQRGSFRELEQMQTRLERGERGDRRGPEGLGRVASINQRLQCLQWNIGCKSLQHFKRERRIGERAPTIQGFRINRRDVFGHRKPAVSGQSTKQDVGKVCARCIPDDRSAAG